MYTVEADAYGEYNVLNQFDRFVVRMVTLEQANKIADELNSCIRIGDIIHIGDKAPEHVKEPLLDWDKKVPVAQYNGFARVTNVREGEITLVGLFGNNLLEEGWISASFTLSTIQTKR